MKHISNSYKNFLKINGRTSRGEFWTTYLFNYFIIVVLTFVGGETLATTVPLLVFLILVAPIHIGIGIRRMHDVNKSGWFLIVPIVNFVYAFSASVDEENRWGGQSEKKDEDTTKHTSSPQPEKITVVNEDSEIEALERRLSELKLQKEQQSLSELEDEKKKKELLKEIETLKKELGE